MRLMTMKELNRVFSLRESRRVKARVRKKNHKRVMKYLNKYGLITTDYRSELPRNTEGDATFCEKRQKEVQNIIDKVTLYLERQN